MVSLSGLIGALPVMAQGVAVVGSVRAGSRHEAAFWQAWSRQEAAPTDHASHATAWREFSDAASRGDPLAPVADTLTAWHLLKADRATEAAALLERYVNADSTEETVRGARELARAWLTRLDRERVVRALAAYRVHAVRYPEQLDDLARTPGMTAADMPPLRDRWGMPWDYRLTRLRSMPTLEGQRYALESRRLGDQSDLRTALAVDYGAGIAMRPVQVRSMGDRPPLITLERTGPVSGTVAVQLGATRDGVTAAYVSPVLLIMRDRLHWRVFRIR